MDFRQFVPPIIFDALPKLVSKLPSSKYKISNYEIAIPPMFGLPRYQKNHKLYDRFLPVLVKHLSSKRLIVDIGANIGDTTVALLANCTNPILCVEPSEVFLPYLEKNIKSLPEAEQKRISVAKTLAGTGKFAGKLTHNDWGTAHLTIDAQQNSGTIALDALVPATDNVALLKSDTDGFDFDVMLSADKILTDSQPVLYWENEIAQDFQLEGFSHLYDWLLNKGYNHIYIFDNFGNLITYERTFDTLRNINTYLLSMLRHNCSRSFHYTDVLAATDKNHPAVQKAIAEYKTEWINKL